MRRASEPSPARARAAPTRPAKASGWAPFPPGGRVTQDTRQRIAEEHASDRKSGLQSEDQVTPVCRSLVDARRSLTILERLQRGGNAKSYVFTAKASHPGRASLAAFRERAGWRADRRS